MRNVESTPIADPMVRCQHRCGCSEDNMLVIGSRVEVRSECSTKGHHGKVVEITAHRVGVFLDEGIMRRYAPMSLMKGQHEDYGARGYPREVTRLSPNPYASMHGDTHGTPTTDTGRQTVTHPVPIKMEFDEERRSFIEQEASVELSIAQVLSDEFIIDIKEMKAIIRRFEEIRIIRGE